LDNLSGFAGAIPPGGREPAGETLSGAKDLKCMSIWIKFCATTCIEDALASIEAGADALGFIFAPSKRRISAEQAGKIAAQLPENIERIGVFSDAPVEHVADVVEQAGLTGVQLHGGEAPEFIRRLKQRFPQQRRITVIKTILVDDHFETRLSQFYNDAEFIDSILLDSGGGSGKTFDWQRAKVALARNHKRLIVAGGLDTGNVGDAIRKFSPWGVDVASGVEREPGRKDPEKLKAFVAAVQKAERP
jgi:phosphoribosylanthranilate isomerase